MTGAGVPGRDAIATKGWVRAHKWLLLRRSSQLSILGLFLVGPLFGLWIVKGNLNSSLTLDLLPLTDPYLLSQSIFAGHAVVTDALVGALLVVLLYLLLGGRAYCSWVCPVNLVTDAAHWVRIRIGSKNNTAISRSTRYWILAATLLVSTVTGTIAWEFVNPVSMLHRGLIFGMGFAWVVVVSVFVFDLLVSRRGWCGHVCPVGAFYSLIGAYSPLRVNAEARDRCNRCMECADVCPEPQVLPPALGFGSASAGPVVDASACTNCGRCIDVCALNVFRFRASLHRRNNSLVSHNQETTL